MEFRRVVVTGLGALTPIGNSVPDYWNALVNGVSGAALIKSFDTSQFKTKFACEVKNFDADAFLGKKDARKLDQFVQYALFSTEEAVKDADLDFSKLDTSRIGVIWGSGIGGLKTFLDEVIAFYCIIPSFFSSNHLSSRKFRIFCSIFLRYSFKWNWPIQNWKQKTYSYLCKS